MSPEQIWERVLKEPQAEVEYPIVEMIIRGHRDIGRDFHGSTLHSERVSWVAKQPFLDDGTRDGVLELLGECNSVDREIRAEKDDGTNEDLEGMVH